jgi:hypothetical protein
MAITPAELAEVRYVQYDYWDELPGGSRLAVDAAARIRAGVSPFGVPSTLRTRLIAMTHGGHASCLALVAAAREIR